MIARRWEAGADRPLATMLHHNAVIRAALNPDGAVIDPDIECDVCRSPSRLQRFLSKFGFSG